MLHLPRLSDKGQQMQAHHIFKEKGYHTRL
jgi:hypothetical protein